MDFHVRGLTRVGGGRRGVPRNFSTLKRLRFYLCVASLWKSCQRFNNFPLGLCRDRLEGNECKIGSSCENRARGELVRRPCWETALRRRKKKKRRRREKKWPIESIQCVLTRRRKHGATGSLLLLLPPSSPGYWLVFFINVNARLQLINEANNSCRLTWVTHYISRNCLTGGTFLNSHWFPWLMTGIIHSNSVQC